MKIEIKYTQFQPADNIEEYAIKRLGSLERFLKSYEKNNEITMFVEIARTTKHHKKGDVFYAEATFQIDGEAMRAESTGPDIRLALDEVKEKLKKEIRRDKDKRITSRREK